jgi:hypothetical protein
VRLDVHRRDAVETLERLGRDRLNLDVEQVGHPQVLGAGDALNGADDGRRLGAAQQVAQGQAARQGVRIRVVVQQNEDAVRVGEVSLVLLDAGPRHRPAELGHQRRAHQLRHVEVRQVGKFRLQRLGGPLSRTGRGRVQHVDERAAGVAQRRHDLPDAPAAVVFDDETGGRRDVGLEIGVEPPWIAGRDRHAGLVKAAGELPVLDQEVHLEAGGEHLVQRADDEFILADGEHPHVRSAS